jgi:pyruvate kinase
VPVIAFTPDERVLRRIPLYRGVSGKIIKQGNLRIFGSELMTAIEKSLLKEGLVKKGGNIVFVASSPFLGNPNIIRLHRL